MRRLALTVLFTAVVFLGFSQDAIVKKDGTKIEAKVMEVSSTTVRYRRFDQPDGPMRTIQISDLKEIIYEDGSWDDFSTVKEEETVREETSRPAPTSRTKHEKDPLFDNGINIDLLLGVGMGTESYYQSFYDQETQMWTEGYFTERTTNFALSFRLGTKFYIGGSDKWRPGIQANWIRLGIYVDPSDFSTIFLGPKTISPVNVGMANVFKFGENIGMEANITTGLNMELNIDNGDFIGGLALTPEVKFRYQQLAVGLDYMRVFPLTALDNGTLSDGQGQWNVISLSIGAKF